jgi:glycosyltransferase involved in cell wall biosynthesis
MEARALGCPVIASDIPAHREVMGPNGTFLPPQDVAGWAEAVLAARNATHRPARRAAAELQAARQAFVAMIEAFLSEAPQLAQPVARRAG